MSTVDIESNIHIHNDKAHVIDDFTFTASKPCRDRQEAILALDALINEGRKPSICNVYGNGPILVSDVPFSCLPENCAKGVIMGIDEAGRGPVLGPMTYGAAYWNPIESSTIPKGFTDSKQLSATTRSSLFSRIQSTSNIGFVARVIHASEISRNMLRAQPYNLNAISHDSAMQMIHAVLDAGVKIDTCYIDTVGIADSYRIKLEREFVGHNINFVVEKKADFKFPPCSAASIIAKVVRDSILESWNWSEPNFTPEDGKQFGSGYPSDPTCQKWIENNFSDSVFCFPDLIRFSWAPVRNKIEEIGVKVQWDADEECEGNGDNKDDPKQLQMSSFFVPLIKQQSDRGSKRLLVGKEGKSNGMIAKKAKFSYFEKSKVKKIIQLVPM